MNCGAGLKAVGGEGGERVSGKQAGGSGVCARLCRCVCVCADTPGESALAGVRRSLGQRGWEKEGRRLSDG